MVVDGLSKKKTSTRDMNSDLLYYCPFLETGCLLRVYQKYLTYFMILLLFRLHATTWVDENCSKSNTACPRLFKEGKFPETRKSSRKTRNVYDL